MTVGGSVMENSETRFAADRATVVIRPDGGEEFLLFLGAGLVADEGMVDALVDGYREAGDKAIVGARVFSRNAPWIVVEGGMEWDEREMAWTPARYAEWASDESVPAIEEVDALGPSALLIPREALEQVGEFDPRFSARWGVVDWCARARLAGYRCYAARKARAWADDSYEDWRKTDPRDAYGRALSEALWVKRRSSRRQFARYVVETGWKNVKSDILSVPFALGTSDGGRIHKRMYWVGRKYAKDISQGARLLLSRMRGVKDSMAGRIDGPKGREAAEPDMRITHGKMTVNGRRPGRDRRELRILFLSHIFPYPLDNGAHIRVHHMMEALSRRGRVDWIGYTSEGGEGRLPSREAMENFRGVCSSAQVLCDPARQRVRAWPGIGALSRQVFGVEPAKYAVYPAGPLIRRARHLVGMADLIWVESMHLAHWLPDYRDRTIVDTIDLHAIRSARERRLEPMSPMKLAKWFEIRKLAHEERRAVTRYSRVVVCSEEERSFWTSGRDGVWVVPNGVSDVLFQEGEREEVRDRLVFVGTLEYKPNEDAVLWFCEDILPRVVKEIPSVSFCVVGRNPSRRIMELHNGIRINVVGRVPDVTPYVREAALSVVPLRAGGGTRLKILESLALGTPVVSTSIGAEGLELEPDRDMLIADDPEGFASAVVRLLRNDRLRRELAGAGNERVKGLYGWRAIQNGLAARVQAWAEERGLSVTRRGNAEPAAVLETDPRAACGANV